MGRVDRWSSCKNLEWRQCMRSGLGRIHWEVGKQEVEQGALEKLTDWARIRGIRLVFLTRNY